jgi:UDP-N-acetylglucosamine acyltransferase
VIDQNAVIDPTARIAENVTIGPWSYIGANVEIGEGTSIAPHVVIKGKTRIGRNNKIFQFSSIGEDPQDMKYNDEDTLLEIGDHNTIREFCTINRGTVQGGGVTRIGNHNLIMAYVHIAHDCDVHNYTRFSNYSALAGHVIVKDYVILSGYAGVHQFCTVGAHSFIATNTVVTKDVLPFVMVSGSDPATFGLNVEGLRRRDFTPENINSLKQAYKIIFRQGLTVAEAIDQLQPLVAECPAISEMIDGLKESSRGVVR